MHRRSFLAATGTLPLAYGTRAMAADARPVFLNYSQEQIDKAYDQSFWAPQMAELEAQDGVNSAAVRRKMPPRTERYGNSDADLMDIFVPPGAKKAPVMVFIHGGAWTRNTREDASYPAPTFVGRGAAWLAPDFGSLKTLRLPDMVENCRRALEWTVRNAESFGGDPDRVFLSAHSSGAHLAACVLITDWTQRGLPRDAIKGAMLMSGMYDLYPVLISSRSTFLHITPEEEAEFSPMRHLSRITCPIAVLTADEDSPEFKRQSHVFADALAGMGRLAGRKVVFDANHFQEPERLAHADSEVSKVAFSLMGL
ncbi:alpha/beta hydrolase [Aquabacter sp. CN5-332]|uniref:alpha/beta hydrolase n=1 Tax=Aquabacter sp. CN5-332 TaxID=3156608 RepID=UPI0032B5D263